jgi:phage terminase large subunit
VASVTYLRSDWYFDLTVPGEAHYFAEGYWHHNTGKSVSLLYRMHATAEEYPESRQLILRKTRKSLTESGLVTFEDRVLPKSHPVLFSAKGNRTRRTNRSSYDYPNGSTIVVGGMDEPTRIFSTDYDAIFWQEATEARLDEWESLLRALRHTATPQRQLFGDCNPGPPTHWLRERSKTPALRMLETTHKDNPALWDAERNDWTPNGRQYMATLQAMTGIRRDRLYLGLWVAAEGIIYPMFSRTVNVVPRFTPPDSWRTILSIDFGYSHAFVAQVWVLDGDGRMYLESEIHMSGRTLDEHAVGIKDMIRGRSYEGVADAASPESIERLKALGIVCRSCYKGPGSVKAGINLVMERMKAAGDGKPRLFVMEDSLYERDEEAAKAHRPLCLLDELESYAWRKDANGNSKEEPVKEDDDSADALAYAVGHVERLGEVAPQPFAFRQVGSQSPYGASSIPSYFGGQTGSRW